MFRKRRMEMYDLVCVVGWGRLWVGKMLAASEESLSAIEINFLLVNGGGSLM